MIGTRLRRIRSAKGMTQRELAEPEYTHAYVSVVESGRRRPSREAIAYFASKLGVEVEELETGRPPDLAARLELRLHEARIAMSEGDTGEAETTLHHVAKDAKRHGLPRIEARAHEAIGLGLERLGRPEEALEHYQRAEEILASEAPTSRVDAVDGKARCFSSLGDGRYAVFLLESLLDAIERERLRDPNALARIHAGLVYSYLDLGLFAKAAQSASELERLAPRITDPMRVAQMHMNVARQYLSDGRIEDAKRSLERAEDVYRQLNLRTEMGGAHLARGYVLAHEGQLPEARRELEEARAIFEETVNEKDLPRTLNELARVERLEGELDRARELLERSIALLGDADAPILGGAHRQLGTTLAGTDPATAEKHFRAAIELYERAEQRVDVALTYRELGDLLREGPGPEAACEAYRDGLLALDRNL